MTVRSIKPTILRPSLLVVLNTTISGNVKYNRRDIELDHELEDGSREAVWQTERKIIDPKEQKGALNVRAKAWAKLRKVCSRSNFGLMCLEGQQGELERAVAESRAIADEFNATAKHSKVGIYIMIGQVASSDKEAILSMKNEVRDLMSKMQNGISKQDIKMIRDAAAAARQIKSMLTPEASEAVQKAVEVARKAASKIAKAGEEAAKVVDMESIKAITIQRASFLDLESDIELQAPAAQGRALAIDPEPASDAVAAAGAPAPVLDLTELEVKAPEVTPVAQLDLEDAIESASKLDTQAGSEGPAIVPTPKKKATPKAPKPAPAKTPKTKNASKKVAEKGVAAQAAA